MTLSWATQVSSAPIRVGIAVQKSAVTHRLIASGGVFSLNLLHRADRALVRKFVKPAAFDPDAQTLNGVPIRDGVTGAPILIQAAAYLDCDVVQAVDTGDHTFFVGSVLDANFGSIEGEIAESAAPEVLRMEDTRMNYGG